MARRSKSSNNRRQSGLIENEDDTKFYIKFKDPRSKSQIFYYFDEEDIFDPCIPLNHGDIVSDSAELPVVSKKINKKPVNPKVKSTPKPILKADDVELPYFEDSTLQVQTANILPPAKVPPKKPELPPVVKKPASSIIEFDDNFEDVGYMTAMDMKFNPEPEIEKEIDEEPYQELEEYKEPEKKPNRNILNLRTAIESVESEDDTNDHEILTPVCLTKEEFDKNTGQKECPEYKDWAESHLSKNTIAARQISATEFRLLKKLIGLKTK